MSTLRDTASSAMHVFAFLGGSLAIMFVLGVVLAIGLALSSSGISSTDIMDSMNGLQMGLLTIVQILMLAVWATALASTLGPPGVWFTTSVASAPDRLRHAMALRKPSLAFMAVAVVGGLTVWTFPSYLAGFLIEYFQVQSVSLEATSQFLAEGPALHRLVMGFAVVVTAPLCEEWIFRGYLWQVATRAGGQGFALVFTTAVFALYHIDPVHVVSLLPTAVFLGWLRYSSGSIWPSVLGHFANNGIAVVVVLLLGVDSDAELPLLPSLLGTAFTACLCAAVSLWTRAPSTFGAHP